MITQIFREDLVQLAISQFQAAHQNCDHCRIYHAIWPYLRIAGAVGGVEADEPFLQPILQELLLTERSKVLIAGSADSGVTALVARAAAQLGHHVHLTVIDRCLTPLLTCQAYALTQGLDLSFYQANLLNVIFSHKFDLIVGHSVLPFIPAAERRTMLAALANNLTPNGRIMFTVRISSDEDKKNSIILKDGLSSPDAMAEFVIKKLESHSISLPVSLSTFHTMVCDYFQRKLQISQFTSLETLVADFEAVGLQLTHLLPLGYGNPYRMDGNFSGARIKGWAYVVEPKNIRSIRPDSM